jgi:hypothetical protein
MTLFPIWAASAISVCVLLLVVGLRVVLYTQVDGELKIVACLVLCVD